MKANHYRLLSALGFTAFAGLTACGGGNGNDDDVGTPPPAVVVPDPMLQGTAAVGRALANAQVSITDSAGAAACREASIVTTGTGSFVCTLKAGEAAPFFVTVIDPTGAVPPMASIAAQTPASGTPLVVNATPLTTAILAQLAADGNPLSIVNAHTVDAAALAQTTANVVAQLQPVLTSIAAPAGYNPFTTSITAASTAGAGNTADLVLDVVKVGTDAAGRITLGTIDNPAGVAMASSTQTGTVLPAVSTDIAALSAKAQSLSAGFNQCFALTPAQRVLASDVTIPAARGGSTATSLAPACSSLFDPAYLHNGFIAGQAFYGALTSTAMTGAQFSVAEVMLLVPAAPGDLPYDAAVLNIRYVDASGNAGNFITVAANKGTGTAVADWLLYGNQQPVNTLLRASIRQQQQQAPVTQAPFSTSAPLSTYQTGIEFYIDKNGPGSTSLSAARVTGPGLPTAGIVLNRPTAAFESQQSWLNIASKSGGSPALLATQPNNCNCDIFWLQRTQGITGAAATTVRNNPNGANANSSAFLDWAHPLDYGAATGTPSDQYVPFAQFAPGARYKFELFYDGSATPTYTFSKTLLTRVVPATRGTFLAWNAPTPATLDALDPTHVLAGAASSFSLAWAQNPAAEQVRLAQMFTGSGGTSVNQGNGISVARGVTSIAVPAPAGLQFPPLDASGNSYRTFQLSYRTFDNSLKLAIYRYN